MIGLPEDIADVPFGKTGMTRRELAIKMMDFVGYIVSFDPRDYLDQKSWKDKLGYGAGPLVICTIGGTAAGRDLLELCGKSYPILKRDLPDLKMVLVRGPRLPANSIKTPEGVEVKGYVPKLYEHMAAADVVVTAGGGTTTLELTALRRPFLYFPFEHHCEQMIDVTNRVKRQRAGEMMRFPQTTPEILAQRIKENIGKQVDYAEVPLDGARKSAEIMARYLN
jgi:predicted glycosyltransferase